MKTKTGTQIQSSELKRAFYLTFQGHQQAKTLHWTCKVSWLLISE